MSFLLVPLSRTKLSDVPFVITTFFFDVKDQKLERSFFSFFFDEVVYNNLNRTSLGLPPSLEEPYEAEAPRTVLKPSLSSNGA